MNGFRLVRNDEGTGPSFYISGSSRPFRFFSFRICQESPERILPRTQKATALFPAFCGRDYGWDVVPLSPAVRESNGETKWCHGLARRVSGGLASGAPLLAEICASGFVCFTVFFMSRWR